MEGLQGLCNLRELYLSHNGIELIEGLENNVSHTNASGQSPTQSNHQLASNTIPCVMDVFSFFFI